MLAGDLITDEIPPLKVTDTVAIALDWMEQFKVSHLALVSNRELMGVISENDLLDENEFYKGCITLKGIVQNLANMASVQNPGGVIVLELNQNDYSVTQIGNIVEGNDAKILSLHVSSVPDSTKIEVTVKVNREDLSRILQTFYRYNYIVKASYHYGDYESDLKGRLDEFMHFLNI